MAIQHPFNDERVSTNFPGSPHTMVFVGFSKLFPFDGLSYLFPCYGKFMRKLMYLPYDEVYYRMG